MPLNRLVSRKTHPKPLHHLVLVHTKLLRVLAGKLPNRKRPAVEPRAECNRALVRLHLHITEGLVIVSCDDNVDRFNDTREILEQVLLAELQLEQRAIHLVDNHNGFDTLTKRLTQHRLGLHTHSLDGVDDDQGAIRHT